MFTISLHEYGKGSVAHIGYSASVGNIKIKRASGDVESFSVHSTKSPRISLWFDSSSPLGYLIKSGSKEKVKIVLDGRKFYKSSSSVYVFDLVTQ